MITYATNQAGKKIRIELPLATVYDHFSKPDDANHFLDASTVAMLCEKLSITKPQCGAYIERAPKRPQPWPIFVYSGCDVIEELYPLGFSF